MSASLISDDDKVTMSNKATQVHPGVQRSLEEYITDHISYPPAAMIHRVQGTVYVRFTIKDDGTLLEISTIGNRIGYGLEEEAIRVVNDIPEWILINIKGEKSKRILPIVFKISDEGKLKV